MAQPDIHELAPAYALDALDPEDRWTYERHLDTCDDCREEVAALRETAAELALAPDASEPPADLRERILAAARAEPRTAPVVPLRQRWALPASTAAAAVAAVAAITLGLWANSLRDAGTRVIALQGTSAGQLVVDGGEATLVVCVEEPPAGKTYEAWVITDERPRPAGLFGGGCRAVRLEEPVGDGDTVAFTLEDEGGSNVPTGSILGRADV